MQSLDVAARRRTRIARLRGRTGPVRELLSAAPRELFPARGSYGVVVGSAGAYSTCTPGWVLPAAPPVLAAVPAPPVAAGGLALVAGAAGGSAGAGGGSGGA